MTGRGGRSASSGASVDVLAASAGRAEALALVSAERAWTYRELAREVDGRAEALRADGVASGSLVPRVLEADGAGVTTLLALWRLGAVPVPLHARSTDAEREAARALGSAPVGTQVVVWTSGTGGRPRGVALGFEGFAASARGAADRLALGPDDVWLASLSPAHVGGLALLTRSLLLGSTMVAVGAFDVASASDLIDAGTVTHASLVPTQLLRLLDHRRGAAAPPTFRCALIGGAHAPAALVERAHRGGWPLALTYGSTEMSSQVATAPPDLVRSKPGTVGAPLAGTDVRIGDDDEILVRGETMALGYLSSGPAEGERARVGPVADRDGWYHTGDRGRLDGDGHLWVTGRRVDRIVSGGVTIDAIEVEEALRAHPAVLDCCVVGVPDEEWGERVAVWVEPVEGEFDRDEVESDLRRRLSGPKVPRSWQVGGELPRNPNGKVDRARVRARLGAT